MTSPKNSGPNDEFLAYFEVHGYKKTGEKYGISKSTVYRWRSEGIPGYVFTPKIEKTEKSFLHAQFRQEYKVYGRKALAEKWGIAPKTAYNWYKKGFPKSNNSLFDARKAKRPIDHKYKKAVLGKKATVITKKSVSAPKIKDRTKAIFGNIRFDVYYKGRLIESEKHINTSFYDPSDRRKCNAELNEKVEKLLSLEWETDPGFRTDRRYEIDLLSARIITKKFKEDKVQKFLDLQSERRAKKGRRGA